MNTTHLADHFGALKPWTPRLVSELNGQHVRLARLEGEFIWHQHAEEDELFLVLQGSFEMHLRDGIQRIGEGDLFVVPRGVEHKPVAPEPCTVLIFEPASVRNTGEIENERTIDPDQLEAL